MNLNYFLSVKKMLEVLQHDHITVNTTIYCVIQQLLFMSRFETRKLALAAG